MFNMRFIIASVALMATRFVGLHAFNQTACQMPTLNDSCVFLESRWFYDIQVEECILTLFTTCQLSSGLGFTSEDQCYKQCKEKLINLEPPEKPTVGIVLSDRAILYWYPPKNFKPHLPFDKNSTEVECVDDELYFDEETGIPMLKNCSEKTSSNDKNSTSNSTGESNPGPNAGESTGTSNAGETSRSTQTVDWADVKMEDFEGKTLVPFHLANLTGFIVELKNSKGGTMKTMKVNSSVNEVEVEDLTPNTSYTIIISATYITNTTVAAAEISLKTLVDPNRSYNCHCDAMGTITGPQKCNFTSKVICPCKPDRAGMFCELCAHGYYRTTPTLRCHKCPCDTQSSTGSCYFHEGYLRCMTCKEAYSGNLCHRCANGYYRDFSKGSHVCTKCPGCHNIIPGLVCDPYTGHCKNCAYNTTGDHCERCKDGFDGDPTKNIPCTQKAMKADNFTPPKSGLIAAIVVGTIVLLSGVVGFIVYKCCHNFPKHKPFWTIEFKEDHEDVNFSSVPEDELEHQEDLRFYEEQERMKTKNLPSYAPLKEEF